MAEKGIILADLKEKAIYEGQVLLEPIFPKKAFYEFLPSRFENNLILEKAREYFIDNNIYIYGNHVGAGKTHLAYSLIRENCFSFKIIKTSDTYKVQPILKQIEQKTPAQIFRDSRKSKNAFEEDDFFDRYFKCVLLVDDLGTEKITDYAYQVIYEILNGRLMCGTKKMIITSNYSLDDLARIIDMSVAGKGLNISGKRISSRIAGMCKVVKLEGKDWRIN